MVIGLEGYGCAAATTGIENAVRKIAQSAAETRLTVIGRSCPHSRIARAMTDIFSAASGAPPVRSRQYDV
jgi:hypothetical protein